MIPKLDKLSNDQLCYLLELVQHSSSTEYWEIGEGSTPMVITEGTYAYKVPKPYYDEDLEQSYLDAEADYKEEFKVLKELEKVEIYPKPIYVTDDILCMERIGGYHQHELMQNQLLEIPKESITKFMMGIIETYRLGFEPRDFNLSNVKITEDYKIYMVDVGLFKKSDNPVYCIPLALERLVEPYEDLKQEMYKYFGYIREEEL